MQAIGLGMALVPTEKDSRILQGFVSTLTKEGLEFGFALHTANSYPHLSLMQGVFGDEAPAVAAVDNLDFSKLDHELRISEIEIWANRIVFLNFELTPELKRLHFQAFELWQAMAISGSADPQKFEGITKAQQKSFQTTGYPFSQVEYLPHITLAHLREKGTKDADSLKMNNLLQELMLQTIAFEKLVVFAVEPLGICRTIVKEWIL